VPTNESPRHNDLRLIATEEAWAFPAQVERMRKLAEHPGDDPDLNMWARFLRATDSRLLRQLQDIYTERMQIMDEQRVDMQVLSLTSPGVQMFDTDTAVGMAAETNDQIAEAIRRHPTRFAGMASFAPQDPQRAAKEIDRAVNKLGLKTLIVNSHTNGEYLDNPKYWPILEAAIAAKAPIYIHPRNLPAPAAQYLVGDTYNVNGAFWGFEVETALHGLRLIMSGVFDRFHDLKIILGHMGEGIPYWFSRIDYFYASRSKIRRKPSEYFRDNFYITTSGVNDHDVLDFCHKVLGPDRVMWAIDYPYQDAPGAVDFIRTSTLPQEDLEKIAFRNAERIFRIGRS
jgi:5-carboxyvanillate decarboxylase